MPFLDVVSGETYDHLLWADDHGAVFWTEGRESQVAAAWASVVALQLETEGGDLVSVTADRFQLAGQDLAPPPAVTTRRDQLAAYAAGNGGEIHRLKPSLAPAERPKGFWGLRWPVAGA